MPRLPALPKVAFDWSIDEQGARAQIKAKCRLCHAPFYGYSRNVIYPSTSKHKTTCPKYVAAVQQRRALERQQAERKMIEMGLDPER